MYSAEFLHHYARDRMRASILEGERQQTLPSFRRRLAYKFQALAGWLEPDLAAPRAAPKPSLERA
ncbi:MAG: hypothetical protein AVDCRST_MAG86-1213 [uncultured Truepera sp.]|uniref:Uncharacterized protein n=1 Tax=uncultured Truepera sp. TaxID=543023 RepID=A0A6J4V724_9DEIN|nr:MAG: hypothetical protein AVDCRST_MAG86-1213 [uncultured Truepera sp.]